MVIYQAEEKDIDDLIRMRMGYLKEDAEVLPETEEGLWKRLRAYFLEHLGKDCIGLLAEEDGKAVASAVLVLAEKPAGLDFMTGKTGTVMSVFTDRKHRGRGIATKLMEQIIRQAKQKGLCSVDMLATEKGRPIYQRLGFYEINYIPMRLRLDDEK